MAGFLPTQTTKNILSRVRLRVKVRIRIRVRCRKTFKKVTVRRPETFTRVRRLETFTINKTLLQKNQYESIIFNPR